MTQVPLNSRLFLGFFVANCLKSRKNTY